MNDREHDRPQGRSRGHGRVGAALLVCAALGCVAAAGCGREAEKEQLRRELLEPQDSQQIAADKRLERQLFDEKGDLLQSEQKVAGVYLPKGLKLEQQLERRWLYSSSEAPPD